MSEYVIERPWIYDKPPNETDVEVEHNGRVIVVRAIWGREGTLPHWRGNDGSCYGVRMFQRWRRCE